MPTLFMVNELRHPFWHLSQENSNWKPWSFEWSL